MKKILLIAIICGHLTYAEGQSISVNRLAKRDTIHNETSESLKNRKTIYILPDGHVLPTEKLDSVIKSWGGEFSMRHTEDDDRNGVMHLIRITEEMKRQQTEDAAKRSKILSAMISHPAPGFELNDIYGNKYSLASLKGKVVVLNFWFTSCPPCIQEMPKLNDLVKTYDPEKVVFLALTFNDQHQVNTFLNAHQFDYKLLTSTKKVDELYKISSWPTSLVIDKAGIISMATMGSSDIKKDLTSAIDAAL